MIVSNSLDQIRPHAKSGLIWVQTVCNGCRQTTFTLTDKALELLDFRLTLEVPPKLTFSVSSLKRKLVALLLLSYYKCSVDLPYGAMDWSAVCDCDIS